MLPDVRLAAHHSIRQQLSNQEDSSKEWTYNYWKNNMH